MTQELLAREHLTRRRAEEREQVELSAPQIDVLTTDTDLARGEVELELAELELDVAARATDTTRSAQDGSHTCDELTRRERLDDVVVGTELQSDDAVGFVTVSAQHDHRHRVVGTYLA